jgi:hypothetical protein
VYVLVFDAKRNVALTGSRVRRGAVVEPAANDRDRRSRGASTWATTPGSSWCVRTVVSTTRCDARTTAARAERDRGAVADAAAALTAGRPSMHPTLPAPVDAGQPRQPVAEVSELVRVDDRADGLDRAAGDVQREDVDEVPRGVEAEGASGYLAKMPSRSRRLTLSRP